MFGTDHTVRGQEAIFDVDEHSVRPAESRVTCGRAIGAGYVALVAFTLQQRLPSFNGSTVMARDGVLAGYAPDIVAKWGRAADLVDRILKGANLAEMPVEQPTKFEFVINLKTARAIGLDVPPLLPARADEVIE